ncbi:MAG: proton-conducting transporter membrane subunit [Gammaproteobacteria bacterium]
MTMMLALVVLAAPLVAVVLCAALRSARAPELVNLLASLVTAGAALPLPFLAAPAWIGLGGYVVVDRLGAWVVLCAALVYLLSSIYAVGYMRLLGEPQRLARFYALFAGFAWTTLAAPLMNNAGVYWIAVELTTLVSTFLVGFEHAPESIEAAWKYIIVVSAGISLALLGTMLFYWAGSAVLGPRYDMTWQALMQAAPHMNRQLAIVAFLLALVGYGTKAGLAPMHTWLPDAHSEGPAPVSALLSGALLNTALVGILRFKAVTEGTGAAVVPRLALIVLGILSVGLAALFIVRQRGVKRLMAYSSVEHMGVMALGFGFGGTLGVAGALYHMLNHALNKSLMFFGAGAMMRAYGTKDMTGIRHVGVHFPWTGALWIAGAVAITGAPPFGLFLSELAVLRAGFTPTDAWAAVIMLVLLVVIFAGFLNHFRVMYFSEAPASEPRPQTVGVWCVAAMLLAGVPLLVFGLWWPAGFNDVFHSVSSALAGGAL